MTRLLAFTDAHLGGGSDYAADRLADQEGTLSQIAEIAEAKVVDGVLFAGDMYDTPHPSNAARHVLRRFRLKLEHAKIPMLAVNGNSGHDIDGFGRPCALELDATDWLKVSRFPELVRFAGDVAVCTLPSVPVTKLVADHGGGDRGEINELAAMLLIEAARELRADVPAGWPCVLMPHWSISGGALPNGIPTADLGEPVLDVDLLDALGFDVVFAGHIHKAQRLNDAGTILYGGPPHVTSFGDAHLEHGCWILDFEDGATSIEFVPLADRPFVTIDCAIDAINESTPHGLDETDQLAAAITEKLPLTDAVVRLRYTATEEQHRRIDLPAIKGFLAEAGVHKLYQVKPEILKESRARADVDESFTPADALAAWCSANEINDAAQANLHALLDGYLERAAA